MTVTRIMIRKLVDLKKRLRVSGTVRVKSKFIQEQPTVWSAFNKILSGITATKPIAWSKKLLTTQFNTVPIMSYQEFEF